MHPNLFALSLLIAKIVEVEAFLAKHGIEFTSLPLDLVIDNPSTHEKNVVGHEDTMTHYIFKRVATRGLARIELTTQISREGMLSAPKPSVTIHASLDLFTHDGGQNKDQILLTLMFEIDHHDQLVTRITKNKLVAEIRSKSLETRSPRMTLIHQLIFGRIVGQKAIEGLLMKVANFFNQQKTDTVPQA